uniref:Secreted protein n=1 Tax=Anopheles triannulatus TaxID=58253 RepID=A0A2M4AWV5_9DIPT
MMMVMMMLMLLLPVCSSAIRTTNICRLRSMVMCLCYAACCGRMYVGLLLLLSIVVLLLMMVHITHSRSRLRILCRNGLRQRMICVLMLLLMLSLRLRMLSLRLRMLMLLRMVMVLLRLLSNRWQGCVPTRWSQWLHHVDVCGHCVRLCLRRDRRGLRCHGVLMCWLS